MSANTIKPNEEQQFIIDGIKMGVPKMAIGAGAGTGKSTLLGMCFSALPEGASKLYLVFNKSAEKEAKEKFANIPNLTIKTVDAYARSIVARDYKTKVKNYRVQDIEAMFNIDTKLAWKVIAEFNNFCNSKALVMPKHSEAGMYADRLWQGIDKKQFDMSFSYIIKKAHIILSQQKLKGTLEGYSLVAIDEFQDTNDVSKAIFDLIPANTRIAVGDKDQSIYAFRGAKNAMEETINDSSYITYPLTISYRYNQNIANIANKLLLNLKNENKKLVGKGKSTELKTFALLSRTNSELIRGIEKLVSNRATFKLNREPKELFNIPLMIRALDTMGENKTVTDALNGERKAVKFLLWEFRKYKNKTNKYSNFLEFLKNENKDIEIKSAITLLEKESKLTYGRLLELEAKAEEYKNLIPENVKYFLSTVHTAKGLEYDSVNITNDFQDYPFLIARHIFDTYGKIENFKNQNLLEIFQEDIKNGKVKTQTVEEINLLYVAVTRAKVSLKMPKALEDLLNPRAINNKIINGYDYLLKKEEENNIPLYENNDISFKSEKTVNPYQSKENDLNVSITINI